MSQEPLVSVVIPAYNEGAFIDASVGSALSQTAGDMEVIVVDDGSTDDTLDRLRSWNDPRLIVITQTHQGLASALNSGIAASRGAYIGFLDADDVWLPGKLARHIQLLQERPGVDVTFSWVSSIDGNGKPICWHCPRWRGTVSLPQLLADYMIRTMSAVVMRRAAVEETGTFDPSLVRCVDLEFFLRASLLRPNNICAIPEVLSLYRRHEMQRTRHWRPMLQGWNQALRSIRRRAPGTTARVERLASGNMHRYCASLAYEGGQFAEALELVRRSFTLSPFAFLRDTRNWKMGAAAVAGVSLPKRALFTIERWAGFGRTTGG
jgi:glycosyltransferase involved in cell wall biosynthesis